METKYKRAGIIIIGDEILKGHVADTNSSFICKRFHAIGVKVCRITTVPDEVDEIVEEVKKFSDKFEIVVTTGGIGSTHDDITYEAIAKAVGEKIVLNQEVAEVINSYFKGSNDVATNPVLKMAMIPESSKLIYVQPRKEREFQIAEKHNGLQEGKPELPKKSFPVVQVKNVFVLPGMMEWLRHAFDQLQTYFENPELNFYMMMMFLRPNEVKILNELNDAVAKFRNRVIFGSYPSNTWNSEFQTKITMEGTSVDDVTSAYLYLKSLLPVDYINDVLQSKDAELVYELTNGNKSLSKAMRNSLKVIEVAFKNYQPEEIYLSFNGGKDCTVLLHLVWAVLNVLGRQGKINTVYIKSGDTFPEVEDFINECTKRYNLNVITIFGKIKSALTELHQQNPGIKAIFMGTRRTDPYSETLKEFQMCDADWPPLMRVNPILDWSYQDIWDFLRLLAVPYCSLYDEGYTSIGSPQNTQPNPKLKIPGGSGKNSYQPAYRLIEASSERLGRS